MNVKPGFTWHFLFTGVITPPVSFPAASSAFSRTGHCLPKLHWLCAGRTCRRRSSPTSRDELRVTRCRISAGPPQACLWFFGRRQSAAVGNVASAPWSPARGCGGSAGFRPAWRRRWCCSARWCPRPAPGPSCPPPRACGSLSPSSGLLFGRETEQKCRSKC